MWRDAETARASTERVLRLAQAGGPAAACAACHDAATKFRCWPTRKDFATVETTPQHLTLAAPECYERLGTYAQMNPPIRDASHREALWQAVREGVIDVIGSDHAPHTREEKDKTYPDTPSGMPGVQTLVTILLDHVNAGRLTLERFVDLTSAGAARIFGIAGKGRIARGYDADFTIVDLKKTRTHREYLDRLALRLDAVRRHGNDRLAGRHDHPWTDGHARPCAGRRRAGRATAVCGDVVA